MRLMTKFMMSTLLTLSTAGLVACQNADQNISPDISQDIAQEVSPNIAHEAGQVILAAQSTQMDLTEDKAPKLKARSVISTGLQRKDAVPPSPKVISNDKPSSKIDETRVLKVAPPIKNSRVNAVEVQTTPYQNPPKQLILDQVISPAGNSNANGDTQIVESAQMETVPMPVKRWQMDASKSHLKFTATQEGQPFDGEFKNFIADIKFHPDNLAGSSVTVTVPISGVDAGSTDRNSTLPGKAWFSVKAFPDAVFSAQDFIAAGNGAYIANGTLSMKGAARPLSLPFTLDLTSDSAVMRSRVDMNRTQWGIGEKPWDTDEWVGTNVTLDIRVTAQAAP